MSDNNENCLKFLKTMREQEETTTKKLEAWIKSKKCNERPEKSSEKNLSHDFIFMFYYLNKKILNICIVCISMKQQMSKKKKKVNR